MTMYKGELTVLRNALGYEQKKPLHGNCLKGESADWFGFDIMI